MRTHVMHIERMQAQFAASMKTYCIRMSGSVTSYGRTLAHNASIPGSVPNSLHLTWLAADVVYDVVQPENVARTEAALLGLWLMREGDHDHLESIDGRRYFGLLT